MHENLVRRRVVAATTGFAVVVGSLAAGAFGAAAGAASREASTSVDTTYLQDTLGVPATNVIETVTYDRFQWLLRQQGQFAFLVGSISDPGFAAQAVAAEAAARTAGATKVYWYDPNLSGATGTNNLDTRTSSGINLATASQVIYAKTWQNVLGQSLGNGILSAGNAAGNSVTITADDTVVNDSVDPAWDFRSEATPAVGAADNVFFTYDKDRTVEGAADKIADWVDLSTDATIGASVTAAVTAVGGGAVIDQVAEFKWWQSENNRIQSLQNGGTEAGIARYGGEILTDADDDLGWNVEQLTYPELLHLLKLKDSTDQNFVILFGGTWCPNTRAVIKFVNDEAVDNNVKVYNFDLVLDGGKVAGSNGGGNPLHVRDNAYSGSTFNFRPSYLYGDLVRTYFRNLTTQYDPNTGNRVAYYPGGDLNAFPDVVRKLQVPFLINYQRGTGTNPSGTSIKRQWIQQNTDASTGLPTFTEYMSNWWFTNPSAQIGLDFAIPADETTLTPTQTQQLAQARANAAFGAEAVQKLGLFFGGLPGGVNTTRTVTADSVAYGTTPQVTLGIENNYGRVPTGTATLHIAGVDYPVAVAQNAAVFNVAKLVPGNYAFTITYPGDAQVKAFEEVGSLVVTKARVSSVASSVYKVPTTTSAGSYKVTVTAPSGLATATGKVSVKLTKGTSIRTLTGTLVGGKVTLTVPKLGKGTWKASVKYVGDAKYLTKTVTGKSVVVVK